MRIAVCDDQQVFVDKIKNRIQTHLESKKLKFDIDTFTNGLNLLSSHKYIKKYDIIFLDVEMPGFTGEDIAKEFKNEEYKPMIIFTTSHSDFAKKGYKYNAFDFLDKSDIDQELTTVLDNSIKESILKHKDDTIEVDEISIKVKNIMYIIVAGKNADIYITANIIKTSRMPLKFFEKHEAFEDFIKINKNTIVNYDYIISIDKNKLKIRNNINLEISRLRIEDVKLQLMQIEVKRHEIHWDSRFGFWMFDYNWIHNKMSGI